MGKQESARSGNTRYARSGLKLHGRTICQVHLVTKLQLQRGIAQCIVGPRAMTGVVQHGANTQKPADVRNPSSKHGPVEAVHCRVDALASGKVVCVEDQGKCRNGRRKLVNDPCYDAHFVPWDIGFDDVVDGDDDGYESEVDTVPQTADSPRPQLIKLT